MNLWVLTCWLVILNYGVIACATPKRAPSPKCRWISSHTREDIGIVAGKGEIVTIRFCVKNNNIPRKINIITKIDEDPEYYIKGGLEIIERAKFIKEDFSADESQTFNIKIKVNVINKQHINFYFVEPSMDENNILTGSSIYFNDPYDVNAVKIPWDDSGLCDFSTTVKKIIIQEKLTFPKSEKKQS